MSIDIYIDSSSTPTDGDGVIIGGVGPANLTQGVVFLLYYDADHWEYNVGYRDDAAAFQYVIGASGLEGGTISADTSHTLHMYWKTGTGANGEVWVALDGGAWATNTGLDINTIGAAFAYICEFLGQASGTIAAGEWDIWTDDLWAGNYDPEGR